MTGWPLRVRPFKLFGSSSTVTPAFRLNKEPYLKSAEGLVAKTVVPRSMPAINSNGVPGEGSGTERVVVPGSGTPEAVPPSTIWSESGGTAPTERVGIRISAASAATIVETLPIFIINIAKVSSEKTQ